MLGSESFSLNKVFAKTLLLLLTGKGDGVLGDKYGTVWLSGRTGVLGELVKVVLKTTLQHYLHYLVLLNTISKTI